MKALLLALACALMATAVTAQPLPIDRLTPAWSAEHQRAASILSNVTLWSTVAIDTWDSFHADDPKKALLEQGVRDGAVMGLGLVVKVLVHRRRPCAPACGVDNPDYSFWSGHTALAFASVGRRRIAITVPLAIGTGGLRIVSGKHYLSDVLAGAAVGALAGRFIR